MKCVCVGLTHCWVDLHHFKISRLIHSRQSASRTCIHRLGALFVFSTLITVFFLANYPGHLLNGAGRCTVHSSCSLI